MEFKDKNIIINGEAEFALIAHPGAFHYYCDTNVYGNGTQLVLNADRDTVNLGYCSTMAIGRIVVRTGAANSIMGFVLIAKFKSPNGTITVEPIS